MLRRVLQFVREQLADADSAGPSEYKQGYVTALKEVEEVIQDLMWEEGDE